MWKACGSVDCNLNSDALNLGSEGVMRCYAFTAGRTPKSQRSGSIFEGAWSEGSMKGVEEE